jgi:hypothetical protein
MAKYNVNIDYANDEVSDSTSIKEMEDIFKNDLLNFLDEEDLNRVTYKILNLNGPAGGWPEISLSGDEQILNQILDEFGYNNDQNYLKEYGKVI